MTSSLINSSPEQAQDAPPLWLGTTTPPVPLLFFLSSIPPQGRQEMLLAICLPDQRGGPRCRPGPTGRTGLAAENVTVVERLESRPPLEP